MTSPLTSDPKARMATALVTESEQRLIAVYASIRSTTRVPDALVGLGLPLVAYALGSVDEMPIRVAAVRGRHSADNPLLGLGTDVELWSILIRCRSELTITVDVAAGPWTTGAGPLELRVEWMHSDRVVTFHPRGARVVSSTAVDGSLGLTGLEERLLEYAADLCDLVGEGAVPVGLEAAMRIVEAAKSAASTGEAVELSV